MSKKIIAHGRGEYVVEKIDDKLISQHNDLVQAVAKMDKVPLKLFEVSVGAYDSKTNNGRVLVKKELLYDLLNFKGNNRSNRLKRALISLHEHAIFVLDEDQTISPVSYTSFNKGEDYVIVEFASNLLPYISMLQSNFTQYKLTDIAKLDTKHSIVIYKLLMMCFNQYKYYIKQPGKRTREQIEEYANPIFTVKELLHVTDTENKDSYKRFSNFERVVLKKSVNEINAKTDLSITYDKERSNRKVVRIHFHITSDGISYPADNEPKRSNVTPSIDNQLDNNGLQAVLSNAHTGQLSGARIVNLVDLIQNQKLAIDLMQKVYPIYDQMTDDQINRHLKYVHEHIPQNLSNDRLPAYLKAAAEQYLTRLQTQPQDADYRQRRGKRSNIKEELPDWAKHPEQVQYEKPTEEQLAEVKKMVEDFNQTYDNPKPKVDEIKPEPKAQHSDTSDQVSEADKAELKEMIAEFDAETKLRDIILHNHVNERLTVKEIGLIKDRGNDQALEMLAKYLRKYVKII